MVLSSWQSHCETSPSSFDECRMVPSGYRPKTKPDDLGCESACTGCQTATGQVNGRWRILTPHRIETHEPTATKFRTFDYVREGTL